MYVNRLIEFAETHPEELLPLGFKRKRVQWIADIANGRLNLVNAQNMWLSVPDIARSSGTKAILLVDKADYVFGISDTKGNEERSQKRHDAYLALLDEYAKEVNDVDIQRLLTCLRDEEAVKESLWDAELLKMNDIIVFRIRDEEYLHDKTEVRKFWEKYIQPVPEDEDENLVCMFCGEAGPVMDRHTINFLIGPDRTKLISANENAYESHGLKKSKSAPTCYRCEQKYGQTLEYLLTPYKGKKPGGPHMFRLGELTYVYWLREENQLTNLFGLMAPEKKQKKEDMEELVNQVFKGLPLERDLNNFCLLVLSANKGRLVIRDYIEDSIGLLKKRIEQFFEAQDVGANRYYGIYTLAATMYVDATKQMQKYALQEWMDWFLKGNRLSTRILIPLLKQIQVTGTMYPQHAAALKSWLVSQEGNIENERSRWTVTTDKKSKSQAYVLGRLFAVLEKIQQEAIDTKNTITTKFFSSASTTPKSVMGLLIRNAQHHLIKLSKDEKKAGIARKYDERLAAIFENINDYPNTLDLEGQAEFGMGYYHEKQGFYTSKKDKES